MQDSVSQGFSRSVVGEFDRVRAQEQALLSTSLLCSPNAQTVQRLAVVLPGNVGPLSITHASLAEAAARTNAECVKRESFNVFVRLWGGGFLLYASHYLARSLCERLSRRCSKPYAALASRCPGSIRSGRTAAEYSAGAWQASRAAISWGQPKRLVHFPRSISRCGSDIALPTWSALNVPTFARAWAHLAGFLWISTPRRSRSGVIGGDREAGDRLCALSSLQALRPS